jgi:hypothetical protein
LSASRGGTGGGSTGKFDNDAATGPPHHLSIEMLRGTIDDQHKTTQIADFFNKKLVLSTLRSREVFSQNRDPDRREGGLLSSPSHRRSVCYGPHFSGRETNLRDRGM